MAYSTSNRAPARRRPTLTRQAHVRAHGRMRVQAGGALGRAAPCPKAHENARRAGRTAKAASRVPFRMSRIKQIEIPSKAEIDAHPSQRENSGRSSTDNMKKDPENIR
ncbi:MAG: hypothetical protein NTX42_01505 [Methanothrix sp.]|nr:hypothetical protein [Methanothrix sp.]